MTLPRGGARGGREPHTDLREVHGAAVALLLRGGGESADDGHAAADEIRGEHISPRAERRVHGGRGPG